VVVKAGANRCFLSVGDRPIMTKPVTPIAMVDASGAGDAFNAGYLLGVPARARLRKRDC